MIETIIIFELLFGAFGKRQVSRPVVAGALRVRVRIASPRRRAHRNTVRHRTQFLSLFNAKPAQSSRICGVPCERWSARIDHSVTDADAIVKQRCGAVMAPLDAQRMHHPNAHGQHVGMSRMSRQRDFAFCCARLRPE